MMKVVFAFLFTLPLSFAFTVSAQTESPQKAPASALMSGFTTTLNVYSSQWVDAPRGITVNPVSPGYALYFNYKIALYQSYVTLMLGPGIAFTDFRTNGYPDEDSSGATYFKQLQPDEYKRNKMSLVHLEFPLELRFAAKNKKGKDGFFIAPGIVGGLLINDYMKQTGEDDKGDDFKQKIYYSPNLSKYSYGASVRAGYGIVGVYGYYGLSELFEEGEGPGMTFYKVGLTFGGF